MPLGAVYAIDRGALFRFARIPVLTENMTRPETHFCGVAPFWHRHLWHNINGLWRWRQNGASPPLRIYGAISERYEPKWLTGDRVRCTLFRNCSTTSIWGWRSAISAPIVAPVRQAANYVHCHRNPTAVIPIRRNQRPVTQYRCRLPEIEYFSTFS